MKKIEILEQTTREYLVAALTEAYAEVDKLEEAILKTADELSLATSSINDLKEKLSANEKSTMQTEEDLTIATATIKDLKEKLDAKAKETSTKLPVVTVNGQKFEVTIPKFNYKGKDYTAEDLKSDNDLCKELVAIEFGGLREIRDRKKS